MTRVNTPPVSMPKLERMSVTVGGRAPSFVTSSQRVCVPRWKPMPMQLIACKPVIKRQTTPSPMAAMAGYT
jgi:hypothetical protein